MPAVSHFGAKSIMSYVDFPIHQLILTLLLGFSPLPARADGEPVEDGRARHASTCQPTRKPARSRTEVA